MIESIAAGESAPLLAIAATSRKPSRNFGNSAHSSRASGSVAERAAIAYSVAYATE